jgi:hypothetical protein
LNIKKEKKEKFLLLLFCLSFRIFFFESDPCKMSVERRDFILSFFFLHFYFIVYSFRWVTG